jgi:hypothetical protein
MIAVNISCAMLTFYGMVEVVIAYKRVKNVKDNTSLPAAHGWTMQLLVA